MNFAQWFMIIQIITCAGAGVGFAILGKPWQGLVWAMYAVANVGWFMIASGKA